jgi:hypothetical protein
VLDAGRPCAFCDSTLVKKRGGWKRPDRHRFTRQQLEKVAALHAEGASLRAIARGLYARLGYSSEGSCLETLRISLSREGFTVRQRSSATALANRARRKRLPGETKNEYKRRMRREVGYRCSRTGEWKVAA